MDREREAGAVVIDHNSHRDDVILDDVEEEKKEDPENDTENEDDIEMDRTQQDSDTSREIEIEVGFVHFAVKFYILSFIFWSNWKVLCDF